MGHSFREAVEAVVTNVNDPEKASRIKVRCGALLGEERELPFWVKPTFPHAGQGEGWFVLPAPGDVIEIEYTTGRSDDEVYGESFIANPDVRWRSSFYRTKDDIPEVFRGEHYGKRYGIKIGGSFLLFDRADTMVTLASSKINLGSLDASEPMVLGTAYKGHEESVLTSISAALTATAAALALLNGFVVPPGGGPLPALDSSAISTAAADIDGAKGTIDGHLSDTIMGEK